MNAPVPHVVVDGDPGVDDALALAVLAHAVGRGCLVIDLVTVVGGNVPLRRTAANARFVLDRFGLGAVPVRAGEDPPEPPTSGPAERGSIHGDDGLGGCGPDTGPEPAGGGVAAMVEALRTAASGARRPWLLALGPLTNVARALELEPSLAALVDRVVVMGGGLGAPFGNVTTRAEFNLWRDPAAARTVLSAGLPLTLVPLDVTLRVRLDRADIEGIETRAGRGLATDLLRSSLVGYATAKGLVGAPMHDPLAAAVLTDPDLVRTESRRLDVVGHGGRRGELVPGGDAPPVEVAVEVDVERSKDVIVAAIEAAAAVAGGTT